MDSYVIVALPAVDDKVNRLSSEEVPHLTLAYLGKDVPADDLATIITYVQHACSELSPFYMSVDHRGTLGADQADVLFFDKKHWDFKRITEFRHHLLLNDTLKRAYDSTEQFPEWLPHLTMGYPEKPAKEDDSDYPGIHSVNFDRIAVWTGSYEGPEFRLEYDDYGMDVAMSDISTIDRGAAAVDELFHYGVKGMKWGVTKNSDGTVTVNQTKVAKSLRKTDQPVTVSQRKAGTYVKAKGGQRQTASQDAIKTQAARQRAKRSTTDSLSTKELKDTIERMRLEQEFAKLDKKVSRRGQSFVARLLRDPQIQEAGKRALSKAANNAA